jgi:hypothetical protein
MLIGNTRNHRQRHDHQPTDAFDIVPAGLDPADERMRGDPSISGTPLLHTLLTSVRRAVQPTKRWTAPLSPNRPGTPDIRDSAAERIGAYHTASPQSHRRLPDHLSTFQTPAATPSINVDILCRRPFSGLYCIDDPTLGYFSVSAWTSLKRECKSAILREK